MYFVIKSGNFGEMSKFLMGVATAFLVVLVALGGYFFGKGQGNKVETVKVAPAASTTTSSPSGFSSSVVSPAGFVNPSATIAAIKEMVPAKKYKDMAPFMAETVNVIIYASSCCGDYTKAQAIDQLKYLDSAKAPWDFSENGPIVQKLETDVPQYFKDKTIGVASNKYTAAFGLNNKFLIDKIVLVVDYSIVAPF